MTMALPAGYQVHPNDSSYAWNPTTAHVCPMTDFEGAAAAQPQWGEQDLDEAAADLATLGGGKTIYLDFDKLPPGPAAKSSFLFRIFPPWKEGRGKAYKRTARHRIYARLVPGARQDKDFWYLSCPGTDEGPRPCELCAELAEVERSSAPGAVDFAKMARARNAFLYQGINLSRPEVHFQNGAAEPGILRAGTKLHQAILNTLIPLKLNNTHMQTGFAVEVIKMRGNRPQAGEALNIEYAASHRAHERGPLPPELWPSYDHAINLDDLVKYPSVEEMTAVVDNVRAQYRPAPLTPRAPGLPPGMPPAASSGMPPGFLPHPTAPGYIYHQTTGQVIPAPATYAAPAPVAPPAYAPPPGPPAYAPPAPAPVAPPAYAPPAPVAPPAYAPPAPVAPPAYAPPAPAPVAPPAYAPPPGPPAYAPPAAPMPQGYPGAAPPPPPPAAPAVANYAAPAVLPPPAAPGLPVGAYPPVPPAPQPGAMPGAPPPPPPSPPMHLEAAYGAPGAPPPPPGNYSAPQPPRQPGEEDDLLF